MQLKDHPVQCIRQCCLLPTRLYTPSLVRLCSARRCALATESAKHLVRETRRRRCSARCCNSAKPSADQTVANQAQNVCDAFGLVKTLAADLDSLKRVPLPPACCLSIDRLTGICSSDPHSVAFALAQVCICWIHLHAHACTIKDARNPIVTSSFA